MKWTTKPPTLSGWYWVSFPNEENPAIVRIYAEGWLPSGRRGTRWAGPIPEPEEGEK